MFQVYASLINSERETLWARHNALLLANSLIIGALAISPAALWQNKWGALTMLSAGLIISAAWVGIAVKGWSALRRHTDLAGTFALDCFKHLPNPFAESAATGANYAAPPCLVGDCGLRAHVSWVGLCALLASLVPLD